MQYLFSLLLLMHVLPAFSQQQELAAIINHYNVTGLQVAYHGNHHTATYSVGVTNAAQPEPVTSATVFQAASLSKVVVAYITLRLYDRGLINLDTPAYRYLPYKRLQEDSNARLITTRMLLNHTSGLPNWGANPLSAKWSTSKLQTRFVPGTRWMYSGEGFAYLQKILEKKTGLSLTELAQQEVFKPLQMNSSSFTWLPAFDSLAAYGHTSKDEVSNRVEFMVPNAAYSLLTTADDYTRFVQALLNGTGLQPATAHMMLTTSSSADRASSPSNADPYISWGLGIGLEQDGATTACWHWGDNDDFKCFFIAYPATGESLVFFTNSAQGALAGKDILLLLAGKKNYHCLQWLNDMK